MSSSEFSMTCHTRSKRRRAVVAHRPYSAGKGRVHGLPVLWGSVPPGTNPRLSTSICIKQRNHMEVEPRMNTAKAVITIIAVVGLLAMACSDRPTPVDESQPTPAPTSKPVPPTPVDDSQPIPVPTSTPVPPTPVDESQPISAPTSTPVPPTPTPMPMPNVHHVEISLGGSVQLPDQGIGISFD